MDDLKRQMAERAEELARHAKCTRCQTEILEEESAIAAIYGQFRVPVVGRVDHFKLCGMCGLLLREFLVPGVVNDAAYQEAKQELILAWG